MGLVVDLGAMELELLKQDGEIGVSEVIERDGERVVAVGSSIDAWLRLAVIS